MCSLSFCRMEVHHGIRNARLQGDYSDYALTEPCPLRSTDDPSGLYRVFSGLKTFQGELWSHGPTTGESRQNGAKELDRAPQDRSTHKIGSIDHTRGDRSTCCTLRARSIPCVLPTRSIPCKGSSSIDPMQSDEARSIPFCLSRSINPGQMISQPFDLLGANRLDRTTANRIEPKSTPELFRPIFSHCLGYAVFQSLHCFHCFRGRRDQTLFSQFGEDF
ncbi:unnamed protein product [Microthlaspi erraticum]|uniref:Uncharacterized protein n=1 Tax=Microthlaspi erraticum TaxID=1685480 RepID=A0A6D2HVG2_9BRAS|nr:unnamed protein product [Microthlaspi erraticum]